MQLQASPKRRPAVNVTSLIDVLFLLLTFFIVTTRFIDQSALKVELPEMDHADHVQHTQRFVLHVDVDGQMTFEDKTVTREELGKRLAALAADIDASGGLVMRADTHLSYGDVMEIFDLVRGAGIKRIANATAKPSR